MTSRGAQVALGTLQGLTWEAVTRLLPPEPSVLLPRTRSPTLVHARLPEGVSQVSGQRAGTVGVLKEDALQPSSWLLHKGPWSSTGPSGAGGGHKGQGRRWLCVSQQEHGTAFPLTPWRPSCVISGKLHQLSVPPSEK